MIRANSSAVAPAARKAATIDPAEVPAIRLNAYPLSIKASTAPTRPSPFTPPPSSTRSALGTTSPPHVDASNSNFLTADRPREDLAA